MAPGPPAATLRTRRGVFVATDRQALREGEMPCFSCGAGLPCRSLEETSPGRSDDLISRRAPAFGGHDDTEPHQTRGWEAVTPRV